MNKIFAGWLVIGLLPVIALADYKAQLSQEQALAQIKAGKIVVIDVRTPEEYAAGHVPSAINIPHTTIEQHLANFPASKDQAILLYCRSGHRSGIAEQALTAAGFTNLYHLEGDMIEWTKNQQPQEK
jgi:phage shock protein E